MTTDFYGVIHSVSSRGRVATVKLTEPTRFESSGKETTIAVIAIDTIGRIDLMNGSGELKVGTKICGNVDYWRDGAVVAKQIWADNRHSSAKPQAVEA